MPGEFRTGVLLPGDVLAQYSYVGLSMIVIEDYQLPDVKLDLFGDTPGAYAGLDLFHRVVDQRWVDYRGTPTDRDRYRYGYGLGVNS